MPHLTLDVVPTVRAPHPPVIDCVSPATRERLGEIPVDNPEQVRAAVERARVAQQSWKKTSFAERRAVLAGIADRCLADADELCRLVSRDCGKTRENALMGEVWPVCEKLRWTIAHGEKHLRPEKVSSGILMHKRARLEFHPLGVMGAIVPWNYPMQNILNPIIPALMAGNGIVVKPSEHVAWSSARIVRLVHEALSAEGHSTDLVGLVQGFGETGRALIESGIDGLVFIGSVANGKRVLEAAARTITPVVLELGGKDPFIVCDDADLELAAHAAMTGCFVNCGQNCVASERVLVHERIAADFERRVGELANNLRQGPPLGGRTVDVGAIATPMQLAIIESLVERAVADGARVVAGGKRVLAEKGDYFAPTVLADVRPDMAIMQEETFGPVMLLCRFASDDEAVRIANGTSFGLGSSVFSGDRERARRLAGDLQAGMAGINEYGGLTYMAQDLTFGGVKASGFGRMNGRDGLRACCNVKAVLDDRFPVAMPSRVYPVGERDYDTTKAALSLIYGRGRARLSGLADLVRSFLK
jgi:acyl-CoA reductase-like NAD-dependent aldehyde dehydrogenase